MKKKLLFLLLVISCYGWANAQTPPDKHDAIEGSTIIITDKTARWKAWGATGQLQKAFGNKKPKKTKSEILAGFDYVYTYKGLEVYFNETQCEAMSLQGRSFRYCLMGGPTA